MSPRTACLLAQLLCLSALPGCGAQQPASQVVPLPADMHAELVHPTGSAVLAAPAGWTPAPTLTTPTFPVSAPRLLSAMQDLLLADPRTRLTVVYPDQNQAFLMVRSYALNLPDIVVIQAIPAGPAASKPVIFSQSRYDDVPFIGANQARVHRLLAALRREFPIQE